MSNEKIKEILCQLNKKIIAYSITLGPINNLPNR